MAVKIGPSGGGRKRRPSNLKGVSFVRTSHSKRKKKTKYQQDQEEFDKEQLRKEKELARKRKEQLENTRASVKTEDFLLEALEESAKDNSQVEFLYRDKGGKRSRRVVNPYSLKYSPKGMMLMAHCTLRKEVRAFFIKRITEAVKLSTKFAPEYPVTLIPDIEAYRKTKR